MTKQYRKIKKAQSSFFKLIKLIKAKLEVMKKKKTTHKTQVTSYRGGTTTHVTDI